MCIKTVSKKGKRLKNSGLDNADTMLWILKVMDSMREYHFKKKCKNDDCSFAAVTKQNTEIARKKQTVS